ncbi:MAG: PAS domain-containing protein [Bacteroidales bacterium]|nr:PAS domain-containing protein [Bacteroidales bacterium]
MAKQLANTKLKYTIGGTAAGIIISIIIMIIIIIINNYTLSIGSVIQMNKEKPIILLLLVSPVIVLALVGFFAGIPYDNLIAERNEDIETAKESFNNIHGLIEEIRKGNIDIKEDVIGDDDKIRLSLINLNREIQKTKEEDEARQKEDLQRHWTAEGLALFGAILREYNESIEVLAAKVISELVKYTDAKQAGFYLIEENDEGNKYIKEIANFAYDRKRLANKKLKWGEGLIGASIIEKKTSFLNNVSEAYIEIESGLGKAKPRSILIVPIMTEEGVIHGALELASFKIYEEFEIKFTEQIAESIATTISTLKINAETGRLLEESKEQAKAMTKQEDELRKTISDMQRLQENADMQSVAFRAYQDSTNKALIRAEYSNDGKLLFANRKFIDLFEYKSNSEIQNESITRFINPDEVNWFESVSKDIINNKHFEGLLKHITKTGKDLWIKSSYIGLQNDNRKVEKILFLGFDASELNQNIENLKRKIETVDNTLFKIELSVDNKIKKINNNLLNLTLFGEEDVLEKEITEFIHEDEIQSFRNIIENINNTGQKYEGEFSIINSEGTIIWLYGSIFQEKDLNDNVIAINIIAYDHSQEHFANEKIAELEKLIEQQTSELENIKERSAKRIEQAKEEMKEMYIDIETDNIFFEKTLKILPDAIISINNENKLAFLNNKAMSLFSVKGEEYKGKETKIILPELDKKLQGLYLGDILNYNNEHLPIGKKEKVYIIDKNKKQVFYMMTMSEAIVGLRKRLTVFLTKI